MFEKKVDGRRNNKGHVGKAGRKAKSEDIKLAEKLSPDADEIIEMMKSLAKKGDKDMIKLFMGYYAGNPKVSTTNETTVTTQSIQMKDLMGKLQERFEDDSDFEFDDED